MDNLIFFYDSDIFENDFLETSQIIGLFTIKSIS